MGGRRAEVVLGGIEETHRPDADSYDLAEVLVVNPSSRDYVGWVRVGRGLLYVGSERRSLIEPAEVAEATERASLAEALHRPGSEPSTLDVTEAAMARAEKITGHVERGQSIIKTLAEGADPATIGKEADRLLATLVERYRESRFRDVLRLARVLAGILLLAHRWRDLVWTLELARKAAQEAGDVATQAWAVHELGTLNVAAGNGRTATELLNRARELFEAANDPAAAELTSHNLQQIPAIAPGRLHQIAEWSAAHKAVTLTAVVIALAGGVAGAYALIDGDDEPGQERDVTTDGDTTDDVTTDGDTTDDVTTDGDTRDDVTTDGDTTDDVTTDGEPLEVSPPGGESGGPTQATTDGETPVD